ncbi:MAG: Uma2 family endonuclease [Rhizobiaceae bacterium]|nr:Uma2 family endonuclease [Rhizobiaceae bacterium]
MNAAKETPPPVERLAIDAFFCWAETQDCKVDFGNKLREYQALAGLKTYLIVGQDKRYVWQWTREESGDWPTEPKHVEKDVGTVHLESVGAHLAFDDVYRNVR